MKRPTTTLFVAVAVLFSKSPKPFFYLAPADMQLKKGDRVIVRNGDSFTIPTVDAVDPTCTQLDMSLVTDWVVQKIDLEAYNRLVAETLDTPQ